MPLMRPACARFLQHNLGVIMINLTSQQLKMENKNASNLFATSHDNVIKWKHFPRYWPFVRGIHRSPVNSVHKGRWRRALMFSLICSRINGSVNNRNAGDMRRHRAHYDVTVMWNYFVLISFIYIYITQCFANRTTVFELWRYDLQMQMNCNDLKKWAPTVSIVLSTVMMTCFDKLSLM